MPCTYSCFGTGTTYCCYFGSCSRGYSMTPMQQQTPSVVSDRYSSERVDATYNCLPRQSLYPFAGPCSASLSMLHWMCVLHDRFPGNGPQGFPSPLMLSTVRGAPAQMLAIFNDHGADHNIDPGPSAREQLLYPSNTIVHRVQIFYIQWRKRNRNTQSSVRSFGKQLQPCVIPDKAHTKAMLYSLEKQVVLLNSATCEDTSNV